jgi:hypothetical protein
VWASLEGSLCIRRLTDGRALMARRNILMLDLVELFTHGRAGTHPVTPDALNDDGLKRWP